MEIRVVGEVPTKDIQLGSIVSYDDMFCIVTMDVENSGIKCLIELSTGMMVYKDDMSFGDMDLDNCFIDISSSCEVELLINCAREC